ncbi:MAG: hypothetical protein JXA20_18740 [Spirochaetes bacterium]|nr:hypothetical protein [Spirochaetota bacterium]
MEAGKDIRRLERMTTSLLLNKEIPPMLMERVRLLLKNNSINNEQRYRSIIKLVQHLPGKKDLGSDEIEIAEEKRKRVQTAKKKKKPKKKPLMGPTELSLYIDSLYSSYKSSKLFRKRYLARRNNRFGIGLRKRLVPTNRYKQILDKLADLHELVIGRLDDILDGIVFDPEAQDPTIFNYLKVFKRWMTDVPLLRVDYDKIIWMERIEFDRAFSKYITHFFSFYKLGAPVREGILLEVEKRLNAQIETAEVSEGEAEAQAPMREPRNPVSDRKDVYRYIGAMRFFLPNALDEKNAFADDIFKSTTMRNLPDFLFATAEALVFQRTYEIEELISYYKIIYLHVDSNRWNCSEDMLERAKKDRNAKMEAELKALKAKYSSFETMMTLLSMQRNDENQLHSVLKEYWRQAFKKEWDPHTVQGSNCLFYIYSIGNYFNDAFLQLMNGTVLSLRDSAREDISGSIFSPSYFEAEITAFTSAQKRLRSLFVSKSLPQMSRETVVHSLARPDESIDQSVKPVYIMGRAFYRMGKEMIRIYEMHRLWRFNRGVMRIPSIARVPLIRETVEALPEQAGRPIPFFDCVIMDMPSATVFARGYLSKRIMEDSLTEGVFVSAAAFCFQAASACLNEELNEDMLASEELKRQIDDLSNRVRMRP